MKAYKVWDEDNCEGYSTVVFAPTRSKAKAAARWTDACEDAEYTKIHAIRLPELDKEYRGHTEMEWNDQLDRIALVKQGWHCHPDYWDPDDCEICPATDWCDLYNDTLEEMEPGPPDPNYEEGDPPFPEVMP